MDIRRRHQRQQGAIQGILPRLLIYFSLGGSLMSPSIAAALQFNPLFARIYVSPMGIVGKRADGQNLQVFTGSLGAAPPAITSTGDSTRPFGVGDNTFTNFESAGQRSCAVQFQACQQASNGNKTSNFTVGNCQNQQSTCVNLQRQEKVQVPASEISLSSSASQSESTSSLSTPSFADATSTAAGDPAPATTANTVITSATEASILASATNAVAGAQTTITQGQFLLICDL